MKQIRHKVFETNSSSTHSISVYSDEDWAKVRAGEGYINRYGSIKGHVYTKNEVIEEIKKKWHHIDEINEDEFDEYARDYGFVPSDYESEWLECDVNEYVTKSGEVLHILCEYGYDG